MIKFSFPHRKIFLTALVLVIVSVTLLVAQNTPPSKEAAPAETGQDVVTDHEIRINQANAEITGLKFSDFNFGMLKGKPYSFPILPGSEDWNRLKSLDEKVKATDIPDDILKNMSTDDLLATIIDDPSTITLSAFNNSILAVSGFTKGPLFGKVYQEFFRRSDAAEKVIEFYQSFDPNDSRLTVPKAGDIRDDRGFFLLFTLKFVEAFLLQPELLDTFTREQSVKLLKQVLENQVKVDLRPDLYGTMPYAMNAFLLGKILQHENASDLFANPDVERFLTGNPSQISFEVNQAIFTVAKQFLLTTKK